MYWLIRQTSLSWDEHGLWCPYIKGWVTNIVGKKYIWKCFLDTIKQKWQQKHNE